MDRFQAAIDAERRKSDLAEATRIGCETGVEGGQAGRDPREMTGDELRKLGHEPMSPLKALRANCIDCAGGSAHEARLCTAIKCLAWPFRMGISPWRPKRVLSPEVKAALVARLERSRQARLGGAGSS